MIKEFITKISSNPLFVYNQFTSLSKSTFFIQVNKTKTKKKDSIFIFD